MNLETELLKEHSKKQMLKIANYVGSDTNRFGQLVSVFFKGPYRITQRASWPLSHCVEKNPSLVTPHLKDLIKQVRKPGIHDAVKRNVMRLLQHVDVPKKFHGTLVDICFKFLTDRTEPVAVKAFAMTVLANIVKEKPEIAKELTLVIEDHLPFGSPGYVSRAKKVLKELAKEQEI